MNICKNCLHARWTTDLTRERHWISCTHPKNIAAEPRNLVTGVTKRTMILSAIEQRYGTEVEQNEEMVKYLKNHEICGKEGKWYESARKARRLKLSKKRRVP